MAASRLVDFDNRNKRKGGGEDAFWVLKSETDGRCRQDPSPGKQ